MLPDAVRGRPANPAALPGDAGDESVIPELAQCLYDEALQEAAAPALYSLFVRSRNPEINELMMKGMQLMVGGWGCGERAHEGHGGCLGVRGTIS